jgi:Spy/CpxP family protein refolding chaperone
MKKILITILAVALVATLVISALAQKHGKGVYAPLRFLKEEVELTDQQKEEIKDIIVETQKEKIQLKADLEIAKLELHELMTADTPNRNEIDKKIDEMSELHKSLFKNEIYRKLDIRGKLTDEQWETVKEFWFEHPGMPHHEPKHFDKDEIREQRMRHMKRD